MRNLFLMLSLAACACAQQYRQAYGFTTPGTGVTVITQAQSAAANWTSIGWFPSASKTVSEVQIYASAITGAVGTTGDLTLDLCPDAGGTAGTCASPIASSSTVSSVPSSGGGWITWTGRADALTANTQYWWVVRNTNGTPASNFATIRWLAGLGFNIPGGGFTGATVKTSTNSGSAWTVSAASAGAIRIKYSDNTYVGYPFSNVGLANVSTNERVYSTHEIGALFTTQWPAGMSMNVQAVSIAFEKVLTPAGNARVRIYSSDGTTETLVADSTVQLPAANVDTIVRNVSFRFSSNVALAGQTTYRIALGETTQSDTSSNYFTAEAITVDTDSNSLALLPFGGTLLGHYCLGTCATTANWVSTANVIQFGLLPDPAAEFTVTGGSGGQRVY